jgi:hypothetical protein
MSKSVCCHDDEPQKQNVVVESIRGAYSPEGKVHLGSIEWVNVGSQPRHQSNPLAAAASVSRDSSDKENADEASTTAPSAGTQPSADAWRNAGGKETVTKPVPSSVAGDDSISTLSPKIVRWSIELTKSPQGMGISINNKRWKHDYIVLRKIEHTGQMAMFNIKNPKLACQSGDRIEEINGQKVTKEVVRELGSLTKVKISFARVGTGDDPNTSD